MLRNLFFLNNKLLYKRLSVEYLTLHYPEVIKHINEYDLINNIKSYSFRQKAYHWINNISSKPTCKYCSNIIPNSRFISISKGYLKECSRECILISKLEKTKTTNIEKYGVENVAQLSNVQEKMKITRVERYGVEHSLQSKEISNKFKNTCINKYGKDNPWKNKTIINNIKDKKTNKIVNNLKDKYLLDVKNYSIGTTKKFNKGLVKLYCEKCKKEYEISYLKLNYRLSNNIDSCILCTPYNPNSNIGLERHFTEILDNLDIKYILRDRTILNGKEIDIYIPDNKIGFEFNGVYWHSELEKPKDYHLNKTSLAKTKGIKLVHIWEDSCVNKQDIVKSRILNLLNKNKKSIYARKCTIKKVSSSDSREFLNMNHLQGNVNAAVKLGLYYNDELVSLMTFGKLRKNLGQKAEDNKYELMRFTNKLNTSVIGGASKLFKYFIKEYEPNRVISYADCDWTPNEQDNLYTKLGFKYIGHTGLNYWWVVDGIRENRFKFRKDKLVREGADPLMTGVDVMHDKGYYRCFGTGNFKYEYNAEIYSI